MAEASSGINVNLSWQPIQDATSYRLEFQFRDSDWFQVAEVGGNETAYQHFGVPSDTALNYRLTALVGGQPEKSLTAGVRTPAINPNPYAVAVTLEEPDYGQVATELLGFDPSILENLDPSTFDPTDPSSLDPGLFGIPTISPDTLDLSTIGPESVSAAQRIGPEGGTVSVTGSDGVIYTLHVPPQALPFDAVFVLTPVKSIEDYPFEQGHQAAVQIEPEGVYFDVPATLTFKIPVAEVPEGGSDPALLNYGFAFEEGGQEFHLVPVVSQEEVEVRIPRTGARMARPIAMPMRTIFRINAQTLSRSTGRGTGQASSRLLREFAEKHAPTRPSDQADQRDAAEEEREAELRDRAISETTDLFFTFVIVGDIRAFVTQLLARMQQFFYSDAYKVLPASFKAELWKQIVDKAFELMQPEKCPSDKAAAVQDLVRRLLHPKSDFDRELAGWWARQLGQKGQERLKLLDAIQSCKVKLSLTSRATEISNVCSTEVTVYASIPLEWRYTDGRSFLYGGVPIKYEGQPRIIGGECTKLEIKDLQGTSFVVTELKPIFGAGGEVQDWRLIYQVGGIHTAVSGASRMATGMGWHAQQSGDIWSGILAAAGGADVLGQRGWKMSSAAAAPTILAEWYGENVRSQAGSMSAKHATLLELMPK